MKVFCEDEHSMKLVRVTADRSDLDFYQCDICKVRKFTSMEDQDRWSRYSSKFWVRFWSKALGQWL